MSTKTIEMYQAVCDGCGKVYEEDLDGIVAWIDSDNAVTAAINGNWRNSYKHADHLLCPDCWIKEDDDES